MKTIRQSATFKANARDVYESLMDSKKHSRFTGDKAVISRDVGGRFTAYGDYIEGVNLELIPDRKIVQSWRGSDWPAGQFSTVTFSLEATGGSTRLTFTQTGVPDEFYQDVSQGWRDFYWTPMKAMFKEKG